MAFQVNDNDNHLADSMEDTQFLNQAAQSIQLTKQGHIQVDLPFRDPEPKFKSNKKAVQSRTISALMKLKRPANKTML